TSIIIKSIPYPATASTGKQAQFSLRYLPVDERQHRLRVRAIRPLGLGHGVTPCRAEGPPPSTRGRARRAAGSGTRSLHPCSRLLPGHRPEREVREKLRTRTSSVPEDRGSHLERCPVVPGNTTQCRAKGRPDL